MWLINCVLSPCACNFTVVIIESDAVFLLPQVSGREELEEKSAVHPAQRIAINTPTIYEREIRFGDTDRGELPCLKLT